MSERAAKRLAHGWARALRAGGASSTAKVIAWTLADFAALVTPELAAELGLGEEMIGTLAAWPSVQSLAAEIGLSDERTTRRQLAALTTRDLVVHERRHLRLSNVFVLAVEGVPVRVGDEPGEARATGAIASERPGRSRQGDRGDRPGPIKEDPIKDPIIDPKAAAARVEACAGTSADARVREAAEAVRAAWVEHAGELEPEHAPDVLELAALCVEQGRHGGAPAEHARDAIAGFFAERTDVHRPRPAWVCERFGRYLARGARARAEAAHAAGAEERRRRAIEEHERAKRASVEAAKREAAAFAEGRRVELPIAAAARAVRS